MGSNVHKLVLCMVWMAYSQAALANNMQSASTRAITMREAGVRWFATAGGAASEVASAIAVTLKTIPNVWSGSVQV